MTAGIFLVPNGTFIVEFVVFVVILGLVAKFILPPLNRAMERRQEEIRSSLEAAERARSEADETRAQRQAILDEARAHAREIVTAANQSAERLRVEATERAQHEYDRLVAAADTEITLARRRAIDEVSGRVGALVVATARQVIGREVDENVHRALIDEAVVALRASGDVVAAQAED